MCLKLIEADFIDAEGLVAQAIRPARSDIEKDLRRQGYLRREEVPTDDRSALSRAGDVQVDIGLAAFCGQIPDQRDDLVIPAEAEMLIVGAFKVEYPHLEVVRRTDPRHRREERPFFRRHREEARHDLISLIQSHEYLILKNLVFHL